MKEKILKILNEYFDAEFSYTTNTICNSEKRPVYHYSPEDNRIEYIGRWPSKRDRWNYIYGMFIALKNEPIKINCGPLKSFTGLRTKNDNTEEIILQKVAEEYDHYLTFLDSNYVYNLIERGNKARIISDELSFQVHLRSTETNWLLRISNAANTAKEYKKIPHGQLILEVANEMQHHIDTYVLTSTFDTTSIFPVKYPQLIAYFGKRLELPIEEAEPLAKEVEIHTGLSAAELEYELTGGRKKHRLQSIVFSIYKIGGNGVYHYDFPSRICVGSNRRIYFKRTDKEGIRNDSNNL
ncbi:hypothetical protein [Bacillus cereus]|uniref:hypothetical protein n=1 Tax=Bacillus cereus TaxID=1396 RepID=UPI000B4B7431|nr:hypothetical protein [Bacillus cereus]